MSRTVFYSWQGDRPVTEGRNLIDRALEAAVAKIAADVHIEEALRGDLKVDKDTKDVPGSPPIFETILSKIDQALIFVADLTICGTRCDGRPTPNPNVLIEYGWALKSLGHFQVITVMNEAHGKPSSQSMPFDLAHLRFPITYNLPNGASEATRSVEREQLAKKLTTALRTILESENLKAKITRQPDRQGFAAKVPVKGKARFRASGRPLGYVRDVVAQMIGSADTAKPIYLPDGPAIWMRVMPLYDPGRTWLSQNLKQAAVKLALLPLLYSTGSIGFLQEEDGCGYFPMVDGEKTFWVAYVFNSGEVWIIDASLAKFDGVVQLVESSFVKTLDGCALFLDSLGCTRPYRWTVGFEGIKGRQLHVPSYPYRRWGACLAGDIEEEGIYEGDTDADLVLRPFFEKVFDYCGSVRPVSL